MTKKAKETFDRLVRQITSSSASRFLKERIEMFSDGVDIPCRRWSFLNQFAVSLYGTHDARGIRQWNEAGRKVKKGAKAIYILVPMIYPRKSEEEMDDEEAGKTLKGFKEMPVFRVEDTEGAPLDYEVKAKKLDVGKLPLIEVAGQLGVSVGAGLTRPGAAASYSNRAKRITMGTDDAIVFLHELSHAVDYALPDRKKETAFCEVVAELSAAFLGSLFGFEVDIPETKAYIEHYAGKGHAAFAVSEALQRVEQIYHYIARHRDKTKTSVKRTKSKTGRAAKPVDGKLPFRAAPFKERSQVFNSFIQKWVKRNESTGMFCAVKKSGKPWKRVAREKEI